MTGQSAKLTVFYDGACPLCRRQRARYERLARAAGDEVVWFDINGREDDLRQLGVDPQLALTELHVGDEAQRIHRELDAYILLMRRVPRLRPLAWIISLPVLRPLLARLYHASVRRRLKRQGRI
ncbi:hypothetical protein GCM10011348_00740 [Marinobacterium nitratireducens]|uniref:Cell division inhibitor n=1 Tax=Marinobacterium nitratireducens TaxID=518897 RepID=A0A918DMS6_9GAMM|nr:DUF393 domain-containing protein [Marinobacterium nitratireducens]GGO75592.1 hypothetical protein GCM10011348_00740 [Marinobacterium nitratireducens]